MASPIDKERNKRKLNKTYLIIGIVLYVIIALAFLHFSVIKQDNPRLTFSEASNLALLHIIIAPFEIFKAKGNTYLLLFLFSILALTAIVMLASERALKKHDNPETVNGEAHLMNEDELKAYNLKFSAPLGKAENDGPNNMIISKDLRLAIDNRGTRRNCNILVFGGSGAGKSRFFAAPNILQYNCNFVITDPSGELLRDYGKALEDHGYAVKVFNLTDVSRSNRYNPFHYIREEKDVFILVNTLIKNTNPSDGHGGDPFWENSEKLLLTALMLYLWHKCPEKDQTFTNVLTLLSYAEVDENDANAQSDLDLLFEDFKKEDPENLAVKQYDKFKLGAGKTLKSILISVGVRLQAFDLANIKYLTNSDDFYFESFSDTKQALFVILPTGDTTFNFLASLLYSQLFTSLYEYAETRAEFGWKVSLDPITNIKVEQAHNKADSENAKKRAQKLVHEIKTEGVKSVFDKERKIFNVYTKQSNTLIGWRGTKALTAEFVKSLSNLKVEPCGPRCPIHVRLILDEFANIGQIPDFDTKLATMRKYEISCSIILQALSQLKDIYKDKWNTLVGNCDTKLFLGSDDGETIEWMLKMLGKKTTTVENTSWQANGNGSTSYNKSSLDLLTVDQITMMQDDECVVRIRGVRPYYGKKFELTEHPNYSYAQQTNGAFVIPLCKDAKELNESATPYRLRHKTDAAENMAQNAEGGESTAKEAPADNVPDKQGDSPAPAENTKIPVQKKQEESPFPNRKSENAARKEKSKEAEKALKDFDDAFTAEAEAMQAQAFLEQVHVSPNATPAQIKESVESYIELMQVPDGDIVYGSTNK